MFRLNVSRAKLSKIQRVTTFADRHWAGEKSPARGRAVFSCCFYCKGCVKRAVYRPSRDMPTSRASWLMLRARADGLVGIFGRAFSPHLFHWVP